MGLDDMNRQPAKTLLLDPDRVSSYLTEQGIDILIGTSYVNYGYITGYFSHFGRDYPGPLYNGDPLVRFGGIAADPDKAPFLITYPGEEGDIIAQGSWIEDQIFWGPKYNVPGRPRTLAVNTDPIESLKLTLEQRGLANSRIALDMSGVSINMVKDIQKSLPQAVFVDALKHFSQVRMTKTSEEISRLRGAVVGAERGHIAVSEQLTEGMTALELSALVKKAVIDEYTDRYIVHVSAGSFGAVVLAPTIIQIRKGELLSVDVGSLYKDYCGDMFRVYAYGRVSEEALDVHSAMDEVNSLLISSIKPGVKASDLYRLGKDEMNFRGLELALDFVGHGLGIDVHEPPYLTATDSTVLKPGMVLVLEVNTRRFDIGHLSSEITCLVTGNGCEIMNSLPYSITKIS